MCYRRIFLYKYIVYIEHFHPYLFTSFSSLIFKFSGWPQTYYKMKQVFSSSSFFF